MLACAIDDVAIAADVQRLLEPSAAATEEDIDLVVDGLLGDRAQATGSLGLFRAHGPGVRGALAIALADVRIQDRGVASVISAVVTLPVRLPALWASSSVVR